MIADEDYCELLTHQPAKPRNRQELEEMVSLLENLGMNETRHSPATERFIETVTTLVIQYEEEIEPGPEPSPAGVLRFLMEEHKLRQVDLVPILGSKSCASQILSGHRAISKEAANKLAGFFQVTPQTFFRWHERVAPDE